MKHVSSAVKKSTSCNDSKSKFIYHTISALLTLQLLSSVLSVMHKACFSTMHRHKRILKAVARCPVPNKILLVALPPTSAAAREHSFRVYHQMQQWLGVELPPTEWG